MACENIALKQCSVPVLVVPRGLEIDTFEAVARTKADIKKPSDEKLDHYPWSPFHYILKLHR